MTVYSFDGAFRNLNSAITGLGDTYEERRKREASQAALNAAASGDYSGAAKAFGALGNVGASLKLLELGRAQADQQAGAALSQQYLGGGGATLGAIGSGADAQPQAGGQTLANLGNPNQIETRFMSGIREAGLTNPYGLATVAAYGKRESGWSPQNANRSWSDPSQSGQAGTSGGLFAWRNERLRNLYGFAQQRGENIGSITPETQAAFLASEDPTLIPRLNNAKSVAEANRIMADAWRFAGYQGNSPEYNARLQTAMAYLPRYQGDGNTIQRATGQPQTTMVAQAQSGATTPDQARAGIARIDSLLNDRELTPQQRQSLEDRRQRYVQIAEADAPAQGSQPAQGFSVPGRPGYGGITPEQAQAQIRFYEQGLANPKLPDGTRKVLEGRIQRLLPYADPARALDVRSKELNIQKAERDLAGDQMSRQAQERAQLAEQYGLQPGSPEHRRFVMTGQMAAPEKPEKPTEGQSNANLYATRMEQAEKIIGAPEVTAAMMDVAEVAKSKIPVVGNRLVSSDFQRADQAKRNFINAVMRRESGAVISPEEFANANLQYFPQPGDGEAVLKQKADNRASAISGIKAAAGPAYKGQMSPGNAMSAARDAIARGAPRDAVIQRLRQNGIDPSGL